MWQAKRKVAVDEGSRNNKGRPSRKKGGKKAAEKQLRKFFEHVGTSIESLIDHSPIGVTECEPWNPSTDKKKAMLSNPLNVLQAVSETIDALASPGSKFFNSGVEAAEYWMLASSFMLMSVRQGLANAVLAEESMEHSQEAEDVDAPPVMVEIEIDAVVSSEAGGDTFVDLGADKFGNSSRVANPGKETMSEVRALKKRVSRFLNKKALPFLDNLTLRANGIVVTSDDCSVECSLASLVDDSSEDYIPAAVPESVCSDMDDFEDCPSVVTEIAVEDEIEDVEGEDTKTVEEAQVATGEVQESKIASDCTQELASDDEYVMTEEPESDDEDFVDVSADFDAASNP